jgi:carbohydrate-binding DOMON domain-containing protein
MAKSLLTLTIGFIIIIFIASVSDNNMLLRAQNVVNTSNLTGIENTTTSATVTARQNVSPPEVEPEDYPTPGQVDE